MGRLKSALISPALCLAALSALGACAMPPQSGGMNDTVSELPQNLIGSTPGVLNAEFGRPALLRVDGTAQVWLYHAAGCGLDLFLYPDAAGVPRVVMATTADGSQAVGSCPADLAQSHIDAVSNMPTTASLRPPALERHASS